MTISELTAKIIEYSKGNVNDINHLLNVWALAKTIGELEKLDKDTLFILEAASLIHDIACPYCREKFGNTAGFHQEKEGLHISQKFLEHTDIPLVQKERIIFLVSHHHTLSGISGADYQILIEADYIVNSLENAYPLENIKNFSERFFKTPSALLILKSIYHNLD